MPILHESDEEIVVVSAWKPPRFLRWLLSPAKTRITFNENDRVIQWGNLTYSKDDIELVEVVTRREEGRSGYVVVLTLTHFGHKIDVVAGKTVGETCLGGPIGTFYGREPFRGGHSRKGASWRAALGKVIIPSPFISVRTRATIHRCKNNNRHICRERRPTN